FNMRILITGGCGFIGSNFIRFMLKENSGVRITNLDKLTYCGNRENLKDIENDERYRFVKGDICDQAAVKEVMAGQDAVVNFAAESHVDRSIKYPDDFLMTNIKGVRVLLDAAREAGIKKFIQIGSDEVYGSVEEGFSKEADVLRPNSPYSSTKAAGDLLALSYYTTYGLPIIVTRSSNNFGPFQYPEKVVPLFITNLIEDKKVPLYGDGGNVRDWLFVEDNCSALNVILEKGVPGEIYNVGGGTHIANIELTERLLKLTGRSGSSICPVNDRPGHDRRYALDSSKTENLGWSRKMDFDTALKYTVDWYKKNDIWWKPLKEKAEIVTW
ncbi:MAG: dTDP-glucose 4,6-dehydratase, partial [Elusimicrobiota bacterium]|nr:dTDP-glucose 4,6-dehydratase [Elusimicrobiota bacterium]